jgi:hypothetical protein
MNKTLRFDFCEPGTVKSSIELSGRGISYICTQLDGTLVYSVTFAAQQKLIAKHGGTYTNDNGQEVAA